MDKDAFAGLNLSGAWRRGFAAARAAASHSDASRLGKRMGAAMFSGSACVSVGFNSFNRSHSMSARDGVDRKIHAEMSAIIRRRYYDEGRNLVVYIWRENSAGPAISNPCKWCRAVMREAGVKRVRYIDADGSAKEMRL